MATQIRLHDTSNSHATFVPNTFIDNYMTKANGEYVKVYLYLLRCLNAKDTSFSISKMADAFEHTEGDIKRALAYWEKVHLLRLEYDDDDNLTGIYFLHSKSTAVEESNSVKSEELSANLETASANFPSKPEYTKNQLAAFSGQEEIAQLLFIAEQYLGRTMNANDISNILYWYNELDLPADLIEYLIEYCVSKKHTSMRYIEKTAQLWYQSQVKTVHQAKLLSKNNSPVNGIVAKAFGIKGRNLADSECTFINKWTNTWHFGSDLIIEACRRTIAKTHQPSFEYTDSILNSWHSNKVTTLQDIAVLDEEFKTKTYDNAVKVNKQAATKPKNKFNNYPQRAYDFEELERQLLSHS